MTRGIKKSPSLAIRVLRELPRAAGTPTREAEALDQEIAIM
jgi:hypothetical protein